MMGEPMKDADASSSLDGLVQENAITTQEKDKLVEYGFTTKRLLANLSNDALDAMGYKEKKDLAVRTKLLAVAQNLKASTKIVACDINGGTIIVRRKDKAWSSDGLDPERHFVGKRQTTIMKLIDDIGRWADGSMALFTSSTATGKSSFIRLFADLCQTYNVVSVSLSQFQPVVVDSGVGPPPKKCRSLSTKTQQAAAAEHVAYTTAAAERIRAVHAAELIKYVQRNLIFQDGLQRSVENLADVLDNANNFFVTPKAGILFMVDEAQRIVGRSFADEFFTMLNKRNSLAPKGIHKASLFFSSASLQILKDAAVFRNDVSDYSSNSANWHHKFGAEFFIFSLVDTRELVTDYNHHQQHIQVIDDVTQTIHKRTNGHIGFITAFFRTLWEFFPKGRFDTAAWLECSKAQPEFYGKSIASVRCALLVDEIVRNPKSPEALAINELTEEGRILTNKVNNGGSQVFRTLIKYGVVIEKDGYYSISSSTVEGIILRQRVQNFLPRGLMANVPKTILEFLTICLPLLRIDAIKRTLSKAKLNNYLPLKEAVWVKHIFETAYTILPPSCVIDPEMSAGQGQVDINVHNGVDYFIEFMITEFAKEDIAKTAQTTADDHTYRFTPTGSYRSVQGKQCAVVNVTSHEPPPMFILPDKFFATLFHYIVADLKNPYLAWYQGGVLYKIPLPFGTPLKYDLNTNTVTPHPAEFLQRYKQLVA